MNTKWEAIQFTPLDYGLALSEARHALRFESGVCRHPKWTSKWMCIYRTTRIDPTERFDYGHVDTWGFGRYDTKRAALDAFYGR